ncbi:PAS domain-containing protein [Denitrobaculum tricleocarpae]|uniref:PAS domain-containing protein n=1 Tax=Denitrobaculum tricleocarpae TaxID=2591009 RepID=A0A545TUF7_9PROT|nr:PAS domain-containing protein [Denitrobaculum tricleocarpae]TQV80846.1 PAS domain-containing protein [Denitrobaculum tricleocarpae]
MFDVKQSASAFRDTIKSQPLARLYDYWVSKSRGGRLPSRAQIDPLDVPELLPIIFLVDVAWSRGEPDFRFRLVGSKITEIVGSDPTGRNFSSFYDDANLAPMTELYSRVARHGEPFVNNSSAPFSDKDFVKLARLLLPLSEDGEQVDMILGALVFENV